jgi:hypothetical protein
VHFLYNQKLQSNKSRSSESWVSWLVQFEKVASRRVSSRPQLPGYLLPDEISQQRGVIVNEDDRAAEKAGVRN